ncbi:MAG: CutA1 divalent ion tolerance protein [Polaromonas sp.]|nr:CutA1 divalent ion tolerance protein [Polaromonas sp.]
MPTANQSFLAGTPAHCIVLTSVATEAQAETLARQIVQARLGACVQIHPLKSVYRWKGEVCVGAEWQLSVKTRQCRFDALAQFIAAHHDYETPEIVQLPITAGLASYLRWLEDETQP